MDGASAALKEAANQCCHLCQGQWRRIIIAARPAPPHHHLTMVSEASGKPEPPPAMRWLLPRASAWPNTPWDARGQPCHQRCLACSWCPQPKQRPSARHGDASLSLMPENSDDDGVGADHVARNASAPVDSTLSHPGSRGSGVQPTARCDMHGGAVLPKHHELRHARARAGQLAMARGATTPSASARSAG